MYKIGVNIEMHNKIRSQATLQFLAGGIISKWEVGLEGDMA